MTTVTQWYFPRKDGQPIREGWYQRDYSDAGYDATSLPDYWDKESWYLGSGQLHRHTGTRSAIQDRPWRGLTSPDGE